MPELHLPRTSALARKRAAAAAALAAALGLALAAGAGADHSVVERVSAGEINGNGAINAEFSGASADGTRAFFRTTEQLVGADTDGFVDIYERANGVTTVVSAGQINGNDAFTAFFAGSSVDGTRVFFHTDEHLVDADTDFATDVYERAGGVTTLVSAGQINGNGLFTASFARASADGTRVFFRTAEPLVDADTDTSQDVYERTAGVTTLVSGGNGAFTPQVVGISMDGTRVFFTTSEQLAGADMDSSQDVYERAGGVTTLVSGGGNGAFTVSFAGASADGTRVLFETSEKLVGADMDSSQDIYERAGGVTTLVSAGDGAFPVSFAGSSADGTRVFFETGEQLVGADTDSSQDVYERAGGVTTLVSDGQVNGDGAFDAVFEDASADGSRVIFSTGESLVSSDTDDDWEDLYERAGGVTTLVSAGEVNGNGAFGASFHDISVDGARVFFATHEALVAADVDSSQDVYERSGGVTTRISAGQVNGNGAIDASFAGASADGTLVFFRTLEQLVGGDTDSSADIYSASVAPPPPPPGGGGGSGGNGGPGGTGTPPDIVDPVLGTPRLSSTRFRAARSGPSMAASVGTRVRYSLSEAAATRFAVQKAARGRRVQGRCVRPTSRNRSRPRCTRWLPIKGRFIHSGQAGTNTFRFRGRIGGRKLRPGGYRLVARATDGAGNTSATRRVRFRIVR